MARRDNAFRMESGGRLIDRSKPIAFFLDGESLLGFRGDTLASALLANGVRVVGRTARFSRPRGFLTAGSDEPNGLFDVEDGDGLERGRPAPTTTLRPRLKAHTPAAARPGGWRRALHPLRDAGPHAEAADPLEQGERLHLFVDVLVIGGGAAGIAAAAAARDSGARVLLVEQAAQFGGRALGDDDPIEGSTVDAWLTQELAALEAAPNVTLRPHAEAVSLGADGETLIRERPERPAPSARLWRVQARRIVVATGAAERPLLFAGNDQPGVMTASAVRDYLSLYGVRVGERVALFTNNDDAYRTVLALLDASIDVVAVVDVRETPAGPWLSRVLEKGVDVRFGSVVRQAIGRTTERGAEAGRLQAVEIATLRSSGRLGGVEALGCDLLATSAGWAPNLRLFAEAGGALTWDAAWGAHRPDREARGAHRAACAGAANGVGGLDAAVADGRLAGRAAAEAAGWPATGPAPSPVSVAGPEGPAETHWITPGPPEAAEGRAHLVDPRSDLTLADLERAARGGAEGLDALEKTIGLSAPLGAAARSLATALLADALKRAQGEIDARVAPDGVVRPERRVATRRLAAPLFDAPRTTPMQGWRTARGAVERRHGDWIEAVCFPRESGPGGEMEDPEEAVIREIRTAREAVGAYDASALRKLVLKGPDAARLVDRLFGPRVAAVEPGRCRIGWVCDEAGAAIADAVVARLRDVDAGQAGYLVHLPPLDIPALEARLRTAHAGLDAYSADISDAWAQIALHGPKARRLIESLSDLDLTDETLPPLHWIDARIAGLPTRLFRLARGGGLGFEIAAPAAMGLALWENLLEAGRPHGVAPLGVAARDAMRIERGSPEIGREADGSTTPEELRRAAAPEDKRWALVGLDVELADQPPSEGSPIQAAQRSELPLIGAVERPGETIGRVTSSLWSPTLGRSVALALLEGGAARRGETVFVPLDRRRTVRASVVDPRFFDPEASA